MPTWNSTANPRIIKHIVMYNSDWKDLIYTLQSWKIASSILMKYLYQFHCPAEHIDFVQHFWGLLVFIHQIPKPHNHLHWAKLFSTRTIVFQCLQNTNFFTRKRPNKIFSILNHLFNIIKRFLINTKWFTIFQNIIFDTWKQFNFFFFLNIFRMEMLDEILWIFYLNKKKTDIFPKLLFFCW